MAELPRLAPLTLAQERELALELLSVFQPLNASRVRKAGGLAQVAEGKIVPISLATALRQLRPDPLFPIIVPGLMRKLEDAGFLIAAGNEGNNPIFGNCYYTMLVLTSHEKRGTVWLTQALGWPFLLEEVRAQLVQICGASAEGDRRTGTGWIVNEGTILTNAHVVTDMKPDEIWAGERAIPVKSCAGHLSLDVGVVHSAQSLPFSQCGVSMREPRLLEPIMMAGFPPVPHATDYGLQAQTGEVSGFAAGTSRYMLFSATARPGNSGGPLFGRDGRIVGLVSRSLERNPEHGDQIAPLPFFAAIPSDEVRRAIADLEPALELPWESYEQ